MQCADCHQERQWLHKHHLIPRSQGGSDDASNLVGICANCHEDRHGGPYGGVLRWRLSNSPEARAKKAAKMRAMWQDPEYRERVLESRKDAYTPEQIAKRAAGVSRYNAEHPEEVTARMRRAVKVREERRTARKAAEAQAE